MAADLVDGRADERGGVGVATAECRAELLHGEGRLVPQAEMAEEGLVLGCSGVSRVLSNSPAPAGCCS